MCLSAVALFILPLTLHSAQVTPLPTSGPIVTVVSGLTVTKTSSSSVDLSWTWFGTEPSSYTVTVTDLTTSTVVQSFSTGNKYASVNGLISGHTYRFSVSGNGFIIVEDIVL